MYSPAASRIWRRFWEARVANAPEARLLSNATAADASCACCEPKSTNATATMISTAGPTANSITSRQDCASSRRAAVYVPYRASPRVELCIAGGGLAISSEVGIPWVDMVVTPHLRGHE